MRAEECAGRIGRAVTEVGASGIVEVDGESFYAIAVGPPIPAGESVEVVDWRHVDSSKYILSFRIHRPGQPSHPPQSRTEQRLAA